jgi:hypothetical protein
VIAHFAKSSFLPRIQTHLPLWPVGGMEKFTEGHISHFVVVPKVACETLHDLLDLFIEMVNNG